MAKTTKLVMMTWTAFLRAAEAGLDHGEAGLHEEHERAAEYEEEHVERHLDVPQFGGHFGEVGTSRGRSCDIAGPAGGAPGRIARQGQTDHEDEDEARQPQDLRGPLLRR